MSDPITNEQQVQKIEQVQQDMPQPPGVENTASLRSPGALLAARREELGLTLERVADQLKMSPRRILEIEADNHAVVHSKSIYRGFVRAYAKVLRMDPDPLIALIPDDSAQEVILTPTRSKTLETFAEARMPFIAKYSVQSKRMSVAIVAMVLLIGVLLAQKVGWLPTLPKSMLSRPDKASAPASVSVSASASAEPIVETKKVASAASSSASASADDKEKTKQINLPPVDLSSQLAPAPSKKPAVNPAPVVSKAALPTPKKNAVVPEAAATANTRNALVLKCREESWIELKRANGELLASRYVPAGTTTRFTIKEPVQLTIGNGPGVEATFRGLRLKTQVDGDSKIVRLNLK